MSYALFERYNNPCAILPWCTYSWNGLTLYQYAFMLPLFTLVALIPVIKDIPMKKVADLNAFGSFLLAVLAEDCFYFLLENRPIPPGVYTTQWGYLMIQGFAIPDWYLFFLTGTVLAFSMAGNFAAERSPFLVNRQNYKKLGYRRAALVVNSIRRFARRKATMTATPGATAPE